MNLAAYFMPIKIEYKIVKAIEQKIAKMGRKLIECFKNVKLITTLVYYYSVSEFE
jgi:hypothetical protein